MRGQQGRRAGKIKRLQSRNKLVYKRTEIEEPDGFDMTRLYYPLVFLSMAGILYLILFSGVFRVKTVDVKGTRELSSDQIISDINASMEKEFFKGNILFFDTDGAERNLKKKYALKTLKITKHYPDRISVNLDEYVLELEWLSGGKYYLVDEKGKVVGVAPGKRNDLVTIEDKKNLPVEIGKSMVTPEFIRFIQYLNQNFTKDTGAKITKIEINDNFNEAVVQTTLGFYITFDTTRDPAHELANLAAAINSPEIKGHHLTYMDMRIKDRVFYK